MENQKHLSTLQWFNAAVTIDRIGRLLEVGIAPEAIAIQMSVNNEKGAKFYINDVEAYGKLYKETKKKALLTLRQTEALIEFMATENDY